ncbi:MAG: glycosyltransferase family 2 protein [Planctomycetaceae bacterium]|nr:glycosyltransferase family 2 protein [Planctomycetaceae bacterium]
MPVYNEERFLRQALESVVEQVDCVILGDNCSTDGTEAICREFAEKYSHVKYFRHEKNFGGAYNGVFCYKQVETEFVFHIGGHDLVPPNYVEELKKTLKENPDAICAYSDVQFIDCEGKNLFPLEFNNPYSEIDYFEKTNSFLAAIFNDSKMLAPYLENPNPLIRVEKFFFRHHITTMIWGLCISQKLLPIIASIAVSPEPDTEMVFRCLLKGKFIHSPHAMFFSRDAHMLISIKQGNNYKDTGQYEEYCKRISGNKNIIGYKFFVKNIMECIRNLEDDAVAIKDKKNFYHKLIIYFSNGYGYCGDFRIDLLNKLKRVRRKVFYPWKIFCRAIKSALIPGYAEKKRKQAEYRTKGVK